MRNTCPSSPCLALTPWPGMVNYSFMVDVVASVKIVDNWSDEDDDELTQGWYTAVFIISNPSHLKIGNMKTSFSWYSPDSPLRVEAPSAAIRPCEVEVDAVAAVLVVDGEDKLADVLLVTPGLVCPVVALDRVVADEGLLHQDLLPFESPVSSPADHALLPSGVFTLTLLVVGVVVDCRTPILALDTEISSPALSCVPALSGPCCSAPVPAVLLPTRFALPEGLISTDDGIR